MAQVFSDAGNEGVEQSRMTDVFLVLPLGSSYLEIHTLAEAGEADVNQPIIDLVQYMESVVESA